MLDRPLVVADRFGWSSKRLQAIFQQVNVWTRGGELPACGISVGRQGIPIETKVAGRRSDASDAPLAHRDALFLMASLTKPVTAIAVMILVEQGLLLLDDHVVEYIPEFASHGKDRIQIRHLLTHTSGLPDMLPENLELRARHADLFEFVQGIFRVSPGFAPGTSVQYSSMAFAILAEIVQRLSLRTLADFLKIELFTPLGMENTSLGWNPLRRERQLLVRLSDEQREQDWNWNTSYWLALGAPWGGLISSPSDYGRLMRMMLNGGYLGEARVLSTNSVRLMISNQLENYPAIPEEMRRLRPWGLGWRLAWPGDSRNFGDLLSPRFFGHWGSTGTLAWADPETDTHAVILTTLPQGDDGRYLARISNMIVGALQ